MADTPTTSPYSYYYKPSTQIGMAPSLYISGLTQNDPSYQKIDLATAQQYLQGGQSFSNNFTSAGGQLLQEGGLINTLTGDQINQAVNGNVDSSWLTPKQ